LDFQAAVAGTFAGFVDAGDIGEQAQNVNAFTAMMATTITPIFIEGKKPKVRAAIAPAEPTPWSDSGSIPEIASMICAGVMMPPAFTDDDQLMKFRLPALS
jgi:hypothetical protein